MTDQHRGKARGNLGRREITWKIVLVGNRGKGRMDDPSAFCGVHRLGRSNGDGHQMPPLWSVTERMLPAADTEPNRSCKTCSGGSGAQKADQP
jgi:hypothetical protein